MAALAPAVDVVDALTAKFPHLPAGYIAVSTVYPDRVELSFHYSLSDFETWRQALRLAPGAVDIHAQGHGASRSWCLQAEGSFAGVGVRLVGYDALPEGLVVDDAARLVVDE